MYLYIQAKRATMRDPGSDEPTGSRHNKYNGVQTGARTADYRAARAGHGTTCAAGMGRTVQYKRKRKRTAEGEKRARGGIYRTGENEWTQSQGGGETQGKEGTGGKGLQQESTKTTVTEFIDGAEKSEYTECRRIDDNDTRSGRERERDHGQNAMATGPWGEITKGKG